ncbi:small subunit rRNA maturation protein TSR4 [Aspergillus chevalieri]|uniref:Programmed cell death protein 2 C-terminal domain-containing protein n=1 Tax=Aspergillus chevalieri TaxID=182096 RepID=A0A7R7VIN5_ASPCH|nr:uncharacterized protein ACHE_20880A [Aspergillus chevalieri]BCR85422.1 hypothetical protein ACHE_20880A [Aspergillus chevalieri]
MDPYDSDSSLEDEDFTETATLLGYPSEEIIDDTISHLGGWPSWPDDATPPPGEFANCKVCNRPMALLLELHGDLPDDFPTDERRLYIFGCSRKACVRKPGSVRALRATKKVKLEEQAEEENKDAETDERKADEAQESTPAPPKQDLGASLFGAGALTGNISANANPFSSQAGDNTNNDANPFATPAPSTAPPKPSSANNLSETFADKVRISNPNQLPSKPPSNFKPITPPEESGPLNPWPDQSAFPPPYPNYYLDADYETLDRTPPTIPENVTIDNTEDPASAGGKDAELKDTFESELDKAFLRFSTRLAHNPEQVLRYEFRGEPLLYSYVDEVGKRLHHSHHSQQGHVATAGGAGASSKIPRCEYCGSERVFELQLVPHTISVLEDGREKLGLDAKEDAGMEWGTIILGVCGKDCGPKEVGVTGWREEWAGVQWEELMK